MQRVSIRSRGSSGPRGALLTTTARRAARNAAVARKRMFDQAYQDIYGESPAMVPSFVGNLSVGAGLGTTEKKVIDNNTTTYQVENTGTQLQLLNGCVPGSQNFNRIGRKIFMRSLQIRGDVSLTDTTAGKGAVFRMVIVYDKQANGSAPTWANIMTSQNIAGTTASDVYAMVNLDNRDRFVILRDKLYVPGEIDATAGQSYAIGPGVIILNEYIPLKLETIYNAGTAGTIGDITSGSLYCFWIANAANASGVTAHVAFRVRFEDK